MRAGTPKLSNTFWGTLFRPDGFLRQEMLTIYLALVAGTTFFGYLFTPDERVSLGNLGVSVLAVCLLLLVRIRSLFETIVHTIMALPKSCMLADTP